MAFDGGFPVTNQMVFCIAYTKKHLIVNMKRNQMEYNRLVLELAVMKMEFMNNGVYGKVNRQQKTFFLKALNTPTSLRLLKDLQKSWA